MPDRLSTIATLKSKHYSYEPIRITTIRLLIVIYRSECLETDNLAYFLNCTLSAFTGFNSAVTSHLA